MEHRRTGEGKIRSSYISVNGHSLLTVENFARYSLARRSAMRAGYEAHIILFGLRIKAPEKLKYASISKT
jgi:hypothetical protein